ncbi:MAG: diphthamide biosynthesis enzyme Dph2 [Desulfurococcaceae archaeon TW002]
MSLPSKESFLDYYYIDLSELSRVVKERKPSKVLLQVPEGFKNKSYELVDYLKKTLAEVKIHIDASPSFGSCLIDLGVIERYDLVIHLGHRKYPYRTPSEKIVYVDLQSKTKPSQEVLDSLIKDLRERGYMKLAVYTTAQHVDLTKEIISLLRSNGFKVINSEAEVVLGCWFSSLDLMRDLADAFLVVAGGRFHALGVGLRLSGSKEVISLDPYGNTYNFLSNYIIRVLKSRLAKVMKSLDAKSWLIIEGSGGQYRPWIVSELTKLITSSEGKYYVAVTSYLTRDLLINIDSSVIDAIVITSCPRLPIEDFHDYEKPVLTPGEAFMALKKVFEPYVFPW